MVISKRNLRILIFFNILRFFCSYYLIFNTEWSDILKSYILFFSLGLDDLDSRYPFILGLYKINKKYITNRFSFNASGFFKDYYIILDKLNDLSSNWMFLYYLDTNKKLPETQLTILCAVLANRTWGSILYFLKNTKYLKGLKIRRNIFFFFPDYFSLYSIIFLIAKKNDWISNQITAIIIISTVIKNFQEYMLHAINWGKYINN